MSCWTLTLSSIFILALKNNRVCWIFFICLCRATVHPEPIWTLSQGSLASGSAWTQNGRCRQKTKTRNWEEGEGRPSTSHGPLGGPPQTASLSRFWKLLISCPLGLGQGEGAGPTVLHHLWCSAYTLYVVVLLLLCFVLFF